jgi:hypothetical protein
VQSLFPGARVDARFTGFLSFVLPEVGTGPDAIPISRIFQLMQLNAPQGGITDWGLGQV